MPAAGDSLSHFRLLEKIGEGGMGSVWKALDTNLGREVALKIFPEEVSRDTERLARFTDEARAVAALNHPGIVTIHSVEQADGLHFLAMELVPGTTLADMIPPGGLPISQFLRLAVPIADAVSAAHEQGVTHRDLKSANIMVTENGRVKILDFGLAQFREESSAPDDPTDIPTRTLTMRAEVRGTLPYMSPEQIQDKPLDTRTDVFSLGVVLYEMATGKRPFAGDSPADVSAAILRDEPRSVTEVNPALPRQLQRIIAHSMQKDRERRLPSTRDMCSQLEALNEEITSPLSREELHAGTIDTAQSLRSIAVLPLENLSGDPAQEFFADGMTEALITGLAKIEALKVISRTSVMQYKGVKKPVREIARQLGVATIVEGTVLRIEDRVRISAQLIDCAADEHLWAESYDREIRDLFALQSEVAQAIACQIRVKLSAGDEARLCGSPALDPAAHEAYLKGRHFWYRRTPQDVKKGLDFFRQATEIDPTFAPAWAGIADSYLVDGGGYLGVPPNEAYSLAGDAARKAVELDDGLAEAHTSLAGVMTDHDWDWEGGERCYRRALELNPNYVTARFWYADHLARLNRATEAAQQARRARESDPLSLISNFMVSWVHYFARQYDTAIAEAGKTLELDKDFVPGLRILGWALEEAGRYEAAVEAHLRATDLSGGSAAFRAQLGRAWLLAGRRAETLRLLEQLEASTELRSRSSHDVAVIHAALGNTETALDWLVRACDEHDEHVPYLAVNPRLDPLRGSPRFATLLERLQLA